MFDLEPHRGHHDYKSVSKFELPQTNRHQRMVNALVDGLDGYIANDDGDVLTIAEAVRRVTKFDICIIDLPTTSPEEFLANTGIELGDFYRTKAYEARRTRLIIRHLDDFVLQNADLMYQDPAQQIVHIAKLAEKYASSTLFTLRTEDRAGWLNVVHQVGGRLGDLIGDHTPIVVIH